MSWTVFANRDEGSLSHRLSVSCKPGSCGGETGIYFSEGLCLPSHAALTSTGAQGFGLWMGEDGGGGGQRVELGPGMELWGWGLGGCCTKDAAWPSRAIWPSPSHAPWGRVKDRWQRLVGWTGLWLWHIMIGYAGLLKVRPLAYHMPTQLPVRKDILHDPGKKPSSDQPQ